jgi:hypothetical protein
MTGFNTQYHCTDRCCAISKTLIRCGTNIGLHTLWPDSIKKQTVSGPHKGR